MKRALWALLLMGTSAAWADAPRQSLRPVARPAGVMVVAVPPPVAAPAIENALHEALRPQSRPENLETRRAKAPEVIDPKPAKRVAKAGGAICGVADIQGEVVGRVPGNGGCGIPDAVKLRAVSGVRLSTPATIDCTTAKALKRWVDRSLVPEVGRRGGGVTELRVAASYACRTRNSQKGARLSEHAKGHAIDISGFTYKDGSQITVLKNWGGGRDGKILKKVHRGACGPFGTVLGPNSDKFHREHFHFDTARYRGGPYCK